MTGHAARLGGMRRFACYVLFAAGCSSPAGAPSDGGEQSTEEGAICPKCKVAGGETSDFGQFAPPTECELSSVATAIDEANARALGFGDALDLIHRFFTSSFAWVPDDLNGQAQPATGYRSPTQVTVETNVDSIQHYTSQVAGCSDFLGVQLHVSLATADGAIAIAGDTFAAVGHGATVDAFGRLDLTGATGSLRLHPPDWPNQVGFLAVLLHFDTEQVRGAVYATVTTKGSEGSDIGGIYRPIDGNFPDDGCGYLEKVLSPQDPTLTRNGESILDLVRDWNASLQAVPAVWSSGESTDVSVALDAPSALCLRSDPKRLTFSIPLHVVSSDGRLKTTSTATGLIGFDATSGAPEASLDDYRVVKSSTFATDIGLSGVDVGGFPYAAWTLQITPAGNGRAGSGYAEVEGRLSDLQTDRVLERLTWP